MRQPTLPGVPIGTCRPTQLHGVQVRHAINAHCCSGVSEGAHGGVPGTPHTGSAEATPTPTKPPTLIEPATAPTTSNRLNMSSPSVVHAKGCCTCRWSHPDGCCCHDKDSDQLDPDLILTLKRSAPETGPPTSPSVGAIRRSGIGCFPMLCLLHRVLYTNRE